MNITDLIAFIIFGVIVATLAIIVIRLNNHRRKLANSVLQLTLEKMTVLKLLESSLSEQESKTVEQTDGFLKFVSDSRDWAFQYIEEVQAGLIEFHKKVDLDIKYIAKYGQLIEHPLQESINRITEAYMELEKLLPTDQDQV